jgi:cytochrome c peroxidase
VIEHYDRGGVPNPQLDPEIRPLHLTAEEKHTLVAILRALAAKSVLRAQLIAPALSARPPDSCARP